MGAAGNDESLIELIYDAPFDPTRWETVVERLADAVGGRVAVMTELNIFDGTGTGMPVRTDPNVMGVYFDRWAGDNPLLFVEDPIAYGAGWHPLILRDQEWLDRDMLCRTPYFNEFLAPLRAEHSMMIRLSFKDWTIASISIARPEAMGAFQNSEMEKARRFQSHIIRAQHVERQLRLSQQALDQFGALIDQSPHAVFFVSGNGIVRRHTAAAEAILRETGVVSLAGGRLRAHPASADAKLQALLATARSADASSGQHGLSLISPDGMRRYRATVMPMGARSMAAFSHEPLTMVTLTQTGDETLSREQRLRVRYGLTAAEARLALAIADGESLRSVADRAGLSINTVRAQLGAVFSKTGCHRQSQLVGMLIQNGLGGISADV